MIAIIDYKIGNISSVVNMLSRLGLSCRVTDDPDEVMHADRIILPGNGAFDACMKNLNASGLIPVLEEQVLQRGVPLLGICVGAQMLGHGSAEGVESGLGWIDMRVQRFQPSQGLRVPHMGWSRVESVHSDHPLAQSLCNDSRFYFVHSYFMLPRDPASILFRAHYGDYFAAGVMRKNIYGVQFHPEKSHRFGKHLFSAFAKI